MGLSVLDLNMDHTVNVFTGGLVATMKRVITQKRYIRPFLQREYNQELFVRVGLRDNAKVSGRRSACPLE